MIQNIECRLRDSAIFSPGTSTNAQMITPKICTPTLTTLRMPAKILIHAFSNFSRRLKRRSRAGTVATALVAMMARKESK